MRSWRPAGRTGALTKSVRVARNVWLLRRELIALVLRRRPKPPKPLNEAPLRCLRCKRELTRHCKGGRAHVFAWPAGAGDVTIDGQLVTAGTHVYVRRQKPTAGGKLKPNQDFRLTPF